MRISRHVRIIFNPSGFARTVMTGYRPSPARQLFVIAAHAAIQPVRISRHVRIIFNPSGFMHTLTTGTDVHRYDRSVVIVAHAAIQFLRVLRHVRKCSSYYKSPAANTFFQTILIARLDFSCLISYFIKQDN